MSNVHAKELEADRQEKLMEEERESEEEIQVQATEDIKMARMSKKTINIASLL